MFAIYVFMLIPVCFCARKNAHVMAQLGGYISKDIMDSGGYLGTYPITRKGG